MEEPRSHRNPGIVARKLGRLREPHVAPLTGFAERLQDKHPGELVPWFDPAEAGADARILVLLRAPHKTAIREFGGSGLVSPDNDDQTDENMWRLLRDADVDRAREVVTWNVVPWYRERVRPPRDLDESRRPLLDLLRLLPEVRVAVLLGEVAARGWKRAADAQSAAGVPLDLPVLTAPHPKHASPGNTGSEKREKIRSALLEARRVAGLPAAA